MIRKITVIGSGNVAWHLSHALHEAGCIIMKVISQREERASALAERLNASHGTSLSDIPECDMVLVSVSDDATRKVMESIDDQHFTTHTCGMLDLDAVERPNIGTFYPLQTFSKDREVEMNEVPFCLEAQDGDKLQDLHALANMISESVHSVSSKQRRTLHLAAVFVSNFVNQLYFEGQRILDANDLDFGMLRPLIGEVAQKAQEMQPFDAQTGPARRQDYGVIKAHMEALNEDTDLAALYSSLTRRIIQAHNPSSNETS